MPTVDLCEVWVARLPLCYGTDGKYYSVKGAVSRRPSCRAFRMVEDSRRFLFLKVPPEFDRKTLPDALRHLRCNGICLVIPECVFTDFRHFRHHRIHSLVNSATLQQTKKIRYRFFGFTEADLKHDALIFLRDNGQKPTREELVHRLGMDNVIDPGRYVASLDHVFMPSVELFSVSRHFTLALLENSSSRKISRRHLKEVNDVKASNGSLVSEGCGAIRQSLADKICQRMDFPATTSGSSSDFSLSRTPIS